MLGIWIALFSGISIGFLGSVHCIGMCGPLALSLPMSHLKGSSRIVAHVNYHLGRALSYTTLGLLFGLVGMSFSIFFLQQWLSMGAGLLMLIMVLGFSISKMEFEFFTWFKSLIHQRLTKLLKSEKRPMGFLMIGLVNGYLPCGLVYAAIIAATATGDILKSTLVMFGFGLGTIPAMAFLVVFGKLISLEWRRKLVRLTPYMLGIVGILLILRGLNLDIPYLSPSMIDGQMRCNHE